MPLSDFSFCFRKGDVGGERGFDAALAFRTCAAAESPLDGDSRKMKMNINSTKPMTIVTGLRRNDRVGPMAALCCRCPQSIVCCLPLNGMRELSCCRNSCRTVYSQRNVVAPAVFPCLGSVVRLRRSDQCRGRRGCRRRGVMYFLKEQAG